MLRQQRIGQEKIGFELANAGLIDQGRQRVASQRARIYEKLKNHQLLEKFNCIQRLLNMRKSKNGRAKSNPFRVFCENQVDRQTNKNVAILRDASKCYNMIQLQNMRWSLN
jgi:hypothetical protein